METELTITRSMFRIMKPLMDQIEIISLPMNSESEDYTKTEIEDICHPLLLLEDTRFSDEILLLKVALRDFYEVLDTMMVKKNECDSNKIIFQNLLWHVYKLLSKKDLLITQNIQALITKCNNQFLKFINSILDDDCKQHLQDFMENVVECLKRVKDRVGDLINKKKRQQLLLCVRQIAKCVTLLMRALSTPKYADQTQLLNSYISKRISWCFQELAKAVESSNDTSREIESGGQFVHKMDIALDILSNFKAPSEELKAAIDEVLCHAMSIAHVANETDRTNISRSSQKVLRALEDLRQRHEIEQQPMQELFVGALSDSLEHLEQQVNSALLQLVLEVFSSLSSPLKCLLDVGDGPKPLELRSFDDLDEFVAVFDLQMDRIMQIGLFAIACSQDTHRVVGIRSCLASLESLELELVPALTALYLEPGSSAHRAYLQALVRHWKEEVSELQNLLHGIVDPEAFCEVALRDASHSVASIKAKIPVATVQYLRLHVNALLKKVDILRQQLKLSLEEQHGEVLPLHFKQIIDDFYFSINELNAVSQLFFKHDHANNLTGEERQRLLKRCELLVSMIKRILPLLQDASSNNSKENANASKSEIECLKGSTLFFPNSLRDVPVDQDTYIIANDEELSCVKSNFTELMKKGKALTKERSVLYCTPKKNWERSMKLKQLQTPKSRTRSIFNKTGGIGQTSVNQSLGLDITNILENLTSLSDTLTSTKVLQNDDKSSSSDGFNTICEEAVFSDCGILPISNSFLSSIKSPTVAGSTFDLQCLSQEVDSLQRIDDLRAVQEKISNLRANAPLIQ